MARSAYLCLMAQIIPETIPEHDATRIIERPDGFYWQPRKGNGREYGPFETLLAAVQDMQASENGAPEPGETLQEAEAEIGIASWIDPETGAPAEEGRPHIENQ